MATSDGNDAATLDKQRRELLLTVYKAAVDEYRFNINLNWERTKFFLTLISSLIAVGVGLMRVSQGSAPTSFFLILYFVLTLWISVLAIKSLEKGKEYTQEAVYTKTLVERELGLLNRLTDFDDVEATLSIAPTRGMRDVLAVISRKKLREDPAYPFINTGSVVSLIRSVVYFMMVIELIGALVAWINFVAAMEGGSPVPLPSGLF